jgi:uncharacterized protein (TIGR02246 family)
MGVVSREFPRVVAPIRSYLMTTKRRVLTVSLLAVAFCSGAPGDDKASDKAGKVADTASDKVAKAGDQTPDKNVETVSKTLAALAKAFNDRDPKAISELFTPHGEFIDADANVFDSHAAIAGEFAALFEVNPPNTIELIAEEIREISPEVLSVDCVATFAGADDSNSDDIDFSALVVKQSDGQWLLASIRSEGEGDLRTPAARLQQLEWLIGEWIDESGDSTMRTDTRLSEDGNFLITDFGIHVGGRQVMSGTQLIGWDASLDKFRSWVFDSEGGHAEGIWTEVEAAWIVKVTGVRPDGDIVSATNIYEAQGPEAYRFSVIDRIVGDVTEPDFTALVVRKPPEAETTSDTNAEQRGK